MERIIRFSGKISFVLLIVLTIAMAIATFIEKVNGTEYIYTHFYGSAWFIACWVTLAVYSLIHLITQGVYKQILSFALHISFLLILLGALITHISAQNGVIHLREGEHSHFFRDEDGETGIIPFTLKLTSFRIDYYSGTESPADYVSKIELNDPLNGKRIDAQISMNNILSYNGYRFYQSSFDDDMRGSVLSINRDVYGIPVTYAGYYLLFISMLLLLLNKNGRFRTLLRSPVLKKAGLLIFFAAFSALSLSAAPLLSVDKNTISREQAAKLAKVWMLYEGRLVPLQTFAQHFTIKLTGKPQYKQYNAVQVLAGWMLFSEIWQNTPFFEINNAELQKLIGKKEASFADFYYPNGDRHYKLAKYYKQMYQGGKQPALIKEAAKLDEKIQIINMLQKGDLLAVFPQNTNNAVQWYAPASNLPDVLDDNNKAFIRNFFGDYRTSVISDEGAKADGLFNKMEAFQRQAVPNLPSDTHRDVEIAYNKLDLFSWLFKINLTLGLLSLFVFMYQTIKNVSNKHITLIIYVLLLLSFIAQSAGLGLRTYIGGRLPLGNGYETMLFIAWCALFIALCLRRYSLIIPSFGLLISGFALLVAHLGAMNPKIGNLVPVLSSSLLSIHVSVIMFSYALVGFMLMNSLTSFLLLVFSNKQNIENIKLTIRKLRVLSEIFLYPCTFFLAAGIFIGAIWANVSWGRYWGWDPKEVWALITLLIAALPFHTKTLTWFSSVFFYNVYILLIFASVLMTYFGVNYFLGGMHSYAGDAEINSAFTIIGLITAPILLIIIFAYRKYKSLYCTTARQT